MQEHKNSEQQATVQTAAYRQGLGELIPGKALTPTPMLNGKLRSSRWR